MNAEADGQHQILIVEDDPAVVEAVRVAFALHDYEVFQAGTLAEAYRFVERDAAFDAVILDLSLPDGRGTDFAQALRKTGSTVPILMVTAQSSIDERVEGLMCGADDYICKPFAIKELMARVNAVLRRVRTHTSHTMTFHDLELDLVRRQVKRKDLEATLSAREVDLLAFFMSHPETILSREVLFREVWDDDGSDSNVLNVYTNYLRNKIESGRYPRLIHTVRGVGFILSTTDPEETLLGKEARTKGRTSGG